jgi:hypothetical protein
MARTTRSARGAELQVLIGVAIILTGCATTGSLPASVVTEVGRETALVCGPDEAQVCRDHGHALKCTCAVYR